MTAPGRITATVGARTQRLVYGEVTVPALVDELMLLTEIDLAHLVMMTGTGLMREADTGRLVRLIQRLRSDGFEPLHTRRAPRGTYLMYEGYLIERLGEEVGGRLHTSRSRNDVKATATAVRLRSWTLGLLSEAVRLQAVLLARARAHAGVVMPIHTHHQAAMPITYGYYLTGIAVALGRDIDAVQQAIAAARCPLGAGAVAGSDLPIDPWLTARLLGFEQPAVHALDAVASRDVVLRVLAAVVGLGLTLSRLATDLQLWSSAEFGYLGFPDRLVGGSSAMPQKRNAFLLEHVKAKAGLAVGAWTATAGTIRSTPFTNSIEVGTEAVAASWAGLEAIRDSVLLCQLLVGGARPDAGRMRSAAETGFVTATAVANRLVRHGVPFRTAHSLVGDAVRRAVEHGSTLLDRIEVPDDLAIGLPAGFEADVRPDRAVRELTRGGGPGAFGESFAIAHGALTRQAAWNRARCDEIARAQHELAGAAARLAAVEPE